MTTVTLDARTPTEERLLGGFHAALGGWRTARAAYGTTITRHVHAALERWLAEGVIESDPTARSWHEPRYRLTAHDPVRLRAALLDAAGQNLARAAANEADLRAKVAKIATDEVRLARIIDKAARGESNYKAVANAASTISMNARSIERMHTTREQIAAERTRINRMCRAAGFDRDAVWAGQASDDVPDDDLSPLGGDD